MKIFDAHCDVLYKMWMNPQIDFTDRSLLHVNLEYLKQQKDTVIQCFAIYVPEHVTYEYRFHVSLEMVELFYEKIVNPYPEITLITTKKDIKKMKQGDIGAILTLEGCDAIGHSLTRLKTLYRLGVNAVGLTWNYANAVADGVLEERGAGLSNFGKQVVKENNRYKKWTDVSHLSEQSFWDTIEIAKYPIASHSNVKSIFNHKRNLNDNQIKALIERDGMIGLTFVPAFLDQHENATTSDLLKHIDHICSLGGQFHLGFGSDFDGITHTLMDLKHFGQYDQLINTLLKYYSSDLVRRFCYDNFIEHLPG